MAMMQTQRETLGSGRSLSVSTDTCIVSMAQCYVVVSGDSIVTWMLS